MVETLVLKAEKRTGSGTRVARRERASGLVPCIIYGHKQEPVSVVLDYHDLALEIQHHHRLLDVELEGNRNRLLVKDIQYDHLGDTIVHIDLNRVDIDERVEVTVGVEMKGTPVGIADGGVLDQLMTEVKLECLVTSIPEIIRAIVTDLKLGETLLAGDLEIPAGVRLLSEPESPVATVRIVTEEVEEEAVVEEEGSSEPEVITREKSEEEQSEEKKT